MEFIDQIDLLRLKANTLLDPKQKSKLGQFFTPVNVAQYMASLFNEIEGDVNLLDAGCGVGSLTSTFLNELINRNNSHKVNVELYDIEKLIEPLLQESMNISLDAMKKHDINLTYEMHIEDFIIKKSEDLNRSKLGQEICSQFSHVIMNPPYKKIATNSNHRKALSKIGIETVNLYTGFLAIAIKLLNPNGELVAIVPRSFTNGPYYEAFRKILLSETSIQHIHIFDSRNDAFKGDEVLQENIIIHCVKNDAQKDVIITSSPTADFHVDNSTNTVTATDMTIHRTAYEKVVYPNDNQKFIHIATSKRDQNIIDRLSCFNNVLTSLNVKVSTGPVVSFRAKEYLKVNLEEDTVPLIYPVHLEHVVKWPKKSKKPNAIMLTERTKSLLWRSEGTYILVKRFSTKEEKRRITASICDTSISSSLIGFDNGLNVFHINKSGFNKEIAYGIFIYLNSTLLDQYYRQFGGHTQVNATDLRSIHYPSLTSLQYMGSNVSDINSLSQEEIDILLDKEIERISGKGANLIMSAQKKIEIALEIITALGLPKDQQNDRSALTLLALLNLKPNGKWNESERPMMGVTPIMDWVKENYDKEYAPNTRETFRRQTLHQFKDAGIVLYNPDKPDRAVNSPKACYQLSSELHNILLEYETSDWQNLLLNYLKKQPTLVEQYAMERKIHQIPLQIGNTLINLTSGEHSQLIKDIIVEFGPRFAPGAEVIYVGDTGEKSGYFLENRLLDMGVTVDAHGKMPDVILYYAAKNWLLLIESVTSHGPVDGKRHGELSKLFSSAIPGIVYVTAFPDRKKMTKYLPVISWETEVWVADAPTHMIHFNGDRFLGPHI